MDDAALSCFVDGRDELADLFRVWYRRGAGTFLHSAEARQDAAIAEGTARHLAGTFGGGFCISHCFRFGLVGVEARGEGEGCQPKLAAGPTASASDQSLMP